MTLRFKSKKCGGVPLLGVLLSLLLLQWAVPSRAEEVEFPLIQSMGYFPYGDQALLEKKQVSLNLGLFYSNVYQFDLEGQSFNDFEVLSPTLAFRYGLLKGLTVEVYYRFSVVFGGVLDGLIENFHESFDLPDNQRPVFPRDSVYYRYRDYFSYSYRKNFLSPPILSFLAGIYDGPLFSLKSRIAVGIPLADLPGFVSDKPFLSAGLILGIRRGGFSLETSGYVTFFRTPQWLPGESLAPRIFFSEVKARLGRLVTGFIYRSSPFKTGHVSHNAYQIFLGYRIGKRVEVVIMEDLKPFDTTPDISLNLKVKLL